MERGAIRVLKERPLRKIMTALLVALTVVPPSFAKKIEPATPESFSAKDIEPMKLAGKAPAVVVPGYRVWFTVQDGAAASSGGGGGAKASLTVSLSGVDEALMAEIADAAFADFMDQLKKTGRTIIGPEEVQKSEAWKNVTPLDNPQYDGAKPGKGLGFLIFSPKAAPLWVHHFDAFGGASGFNQKSTKAMYKLSEENKAVVIVPNVMIRFARVSTTGKSNYSRYAEVGVEPWMAIQMTSGVYQWWAKVARLGQSSPALLKTGIQLDPAVGEIVKSDEKHSDMDLGFGKYWKSVKGAYYYKADPAKYKAEVLKGIQAFNRGVAQAVAESNK